ncbi:MAG: hypothetical protein J0L53_02155 [Spirochaetes bacterium]|nr:hypothetical protein [Spirochaetota bacterium]
MRIKIWMSGVSGVILLAFAPLGAIEKATVEFQGWGGVNFATKSTYSTDFTGASYIQPTFGLTAWASQPFVLPKELDLGLSAAYMPIFKQTAGTGNVTSVTGFPVLLEARYRFNNGIFAAVGGGYAYTSLKINNETANTNAALLSAKGGYQYDIWNNLSAVATVQLLYALQKLNFPVAGDISNSQLNIGLTLGVAYKI